MRIRRLHKKIWCLIAGHDFSTGYISGSYTTRYCKRCRLSKTDYHFTAGAETLKLWAEMLDKEAERGMKVIRKTYNTPWKMFWFKVGVKLYQFRNWLIY